MLKDDLSFPPSSPLPLVSPAGSPCLGCRYINSFYVNIHMHHHSEETIYFPWVKTRCSAEDFPEKTSKVGPRTPVTRYHGVLLFLPDSASSLF